MTINGNEVAEIIISKKDGTVISVIADENCIAKNGYDVTFSPNGEEYYEADD